MVYKEKKSVPVPSAEAEYMPLIIFKNPTGDKKSKSNDIKYHFYREQVEKELIPLQFFLQVEFHVKI